MKVFFIDNLSSFTYNLVEEFEKKDCQVLVFRSDVDERVIDNEIKNFKPNLIVIGPGASLNHSGISIHVIENYYKKTPILGVGLGNGCIIEAFGGKVGKAPEVFFGRQSKILHDGKTIYKKFSKEFNAARYHPSSGIDIPYCLEVSSRTDEGIVMGVRHKEHLVEGIQFNPESILTPMGSLIIENLLDEIKKK